MRRDPAPSVTLSFVRTLTTAGVSTSTLKLTPLMPNAVRGSSLYGLLNAKGCDNALGQPLEEGWSLMLRANSWDGLALEADN